MKSNSQQRGNKMEGKILEYKNINREKEIKRKACQGERRKIKGERGED